MLLQKEQASKDSRYNKRISNAGTANTSHLPEQLTDEHGTDANEPIANEQLLSAAIHGSWLPGYAAEHAVPATTAELIIQYPIPDTTTTKLPERCCWASTRNDLSEKIKKSHNYMDSL